MGRLKEIYSSDADVEHFVQTLLLLEFGDFVQKSDEKLDQTFNRFNHLLSRMLKHNLKHEFIEKKSHVHEWAEIQMESGCVYYEGTWIVQKLLIAQACVNYEIPWRQSYEGWESCF